MNFQDEIDKAVLNIKSNHNKIIDDWCKAYLAQRYKEGKSIDVGSFTLCQQNLSWAQNEVGFKYWFEDGKPNYNDSDGWIKCSEELPTSKTPVYFTYCDDGEVHTEIWYDYYEKDWMKEGPMSSYGSYRGKVTHWMPLPKPPKE